MGPGGVLYAGNTGGAEYALNPNGRLRWLHPTATRSGRTPPSARDGTVFFGSLDLNIYALDSRGRERWQPATFGFVTSSPAIGPDGTVYIGSFDGRLHALDPKTGRDRWTYTDRRPRLLVAALARTERLHRLGRRLRLRVRPAGSLRWRYDTGDTVAPRRSLGRAPRGGGRSSTSAPPTAASTRSTPDRPAPLVLRHDAARPVAARPQRPELLACAGPARRLHRRRARPSCSSPTTGAAGPATRRCDTAPGQPFGVDLPCASSR